MTEKQFYDLIESINSLGKIDWATIIISILGVLISSFIAFWIAKYQVDKSEEQFQKQIDENRHLEKEMYFRNKKIEDIEMLLDSINKYMRFYNLESDKVYLLKEKCLSKEKLNNYINNIKKLKSYDAIDFTYGNVNIPYDLDEERIIKYVNLEKLNEKFYNSFCDTNFMLNNLFSNWNLEENINKNDKFKITESIGRINSTLIICMKLQIILDNLRKYNLSMMKKDIEKNYSEYIIKEIDSKFKLYGFKEP